MTWRRTAHQAEAEGDPRLEASARPAGARSAIPEADAHEAELVLAAVSTEGLPALVRVLLAAKEGDRTAAGMRVGALLRALPETSWFTAHDLVSLAGISETTMVGQLDSVQRSIITRNLGRNPQLARAEGAPAPERTPGS